MPDGVAQIPRQRGKKHPPLDSKWRQQNMTAIRPVMTVGTAFPWTFVLGIVFVALGIAFHFAAVSANEMVLDYTNCKAQDGQPASVSTSRFEKGKVCTYDITLEEDFHGEVKLFYALDKFYQNNRLYAKNRNDLQLVGDLTEVENCGPLDYRESELSDGSKVKQPYAPCGKMADSFFNDTYKLFYNLNGTRVEVPLTTRGMLSKLERERKYKNPKRMSGETLCTAFNGTVRPPSWSIDVCQLGSNETGWGFENIDFQIWMKIAALPKFRKVYRVVDNQADLFTQGLPKGNYTVEIGYNYPVQEFKIDKMFIIAVESWMGPRNFFIGFAYMAVGVGLVVLSAVFFVVWLTQRYN